MMRAGVRCVVIVATPPSPWDVPAITQPQGATEEFSDTLSSTREQMTPHTGAVNKKRGHSLSLSQLLILLVSTFLCRTQHDNTTSWISTAIHRAELPWQHIVTQIFQMTYCQALDAFSLCKWLTAIKTNKQASRECLFLHEKKYPRGGLWRHKHQTPIKHTSTDANRSEILSQSSLHLWTLVFCFSPIPSSPFPSSLCCSCVVSALFHFHFFALAHSDAFNASRVMQVWLSVSVDRQPTLKRCKCPALWSEHGKLENEPLIATSKNKAAASQNQAWTCGCTFLSGGGDARKERRKKRVKRENELRLESEVGG